MSSRRIQRVNSLLKEVITEVIRSEVKNANVAPLFTITKVDCSADIHFAKVYFTVTNGTKEEIEKTLEALNAASGFIGVKGSKEVCLRYFPELRFVYDLEYEEMFRLEQVFNKIQQMRNETPVDEPQE
ncbi:MAG: 30S ribosome-binding factor RbfA [Chlamydiia bacterium]